MALRNHSFNAAQAQVVQAIRAETKKPRYIAVLPTVFPYFKKVTIEDACRLVSVMMSENEELLVGDQLYFALTGHPYEVEGRVTLWLSRDAAEWLINTDVVSEVLAFPKTNSKVEF